MSGKRRNASKPRLGLIPPYAERAVAEVLTFGAEKYGRHNWQLGLSFIEVLDSMRRHINAWHGGEDIDAESGLPHLAHAATNALMLLELSQLRPSYDDRPCRLDASELSMKPDELRKHLDTKTANARRDSWIEEMPIEDTGEVTEPEPMVMRESASPRPRSTAGGPRTMVLTTPSRPIPPWVIRRSDAILKCERCGNEFADTDAEVKEHGHCLDITRWASATMGEEARALTPPPSRTVRSRSFAKP